MYCSTTFLKFSEFHPALGKPGVPEGPIVQILGVRHHYSAGVPVLLSQWLGWAELSWVDLAVQAGLRHSRCLKSWVGTEGIFILSLGIDSAKPLHWGGRRSVAHTSLPTASPGGNSQRGCDAAVRIRNS